MSELKATLALVGAALMTVVFTCRSAEAQPAAEPDTLTVTGRAETELEPDRAAVEAGIVTVDESAAAAIEANRLRASELIAAAKAAGIAAADIRTVQFQVSPRYAQDERGAPDAAPRITGYEVVNQVAVTIRDIERTGEVLDVLLSAGANRVGSIGFTVSDLDKKLDGARTEAVKDAFRRARLYAEAAGVTLGRVIAMNEADSVPPRPPVPYARAAMEAAAMPIEAGSQTASASVTVTFELKP